MTDRELDRRVAEIMGKEGIRLNQVGDLVYRGRKLNCWINVLFYSTDPRADYTVLDWARENLTEEELMRLSSELQSLYLKRHRQDKKGYFELRYLPGDYSRALVTTKGES